MPLINRLSRLFKADLHAALDMIEEPEALLKQSMREMSDLLECTRSDLNQHKETLENVQKKMEFFEQQSQSKADDIQLALGQKKRDLARDLVRKKLVLAEQQSLLQQRYVTLKEKINKLIELEQNQSAALIEMQQQADSIINSPSRADEQSTNCGWRISEADVELALLKETQKFARSKTQEQ